MSSFSFSSEEFSVGNAGFGGASFSAGSASSGGASFSFGSSSAGNSGSVNQIAQDLLSLRGGSSSSASASAAAAASQYVSQIEQAILASTNPINISETEEITVLGNRGIWANKQEVQSWRGGDLSIEQYQINDDSNPQVITKRVSQQLEYVQELAIRYLRPPTPPAPGEIVIKQEGNSSVPPAPPVIIRQQPARPGTPEPLVVREAPPQPPKPVGRKLITISGKRIPPPPRKVIIERLAPLPSKPQSVIIERWLGYQQQKRRVIFQKSAQQDVQVVKPRNVIVQWEAPQVNVRKEFKYLGVIRANPAEYVQRYGATLKTSRDLPQFVLDIKTPEGLVLGVDSQFSGLYELEGDVQALALVDLDREGLSEYRAYLQRLGISFNSSSSASSFAASSASSFAASSSSASNAVEEVFRYVDADSSGNISIEEAQRILLRLNSRLGRRYGEDDVNAFFSALDVNNDGTLDLEEFKKAFLRLI